MLLNKQVLIAEDQEGNENKIEPGYNDIALYDTSFITSDILRHQLIPHSYP
jgi:hypothetical protein